MELAWISIAALVVAVAVSCTTAVNVGTLSLVLAWIIGVYLSDMSVETVLEGFPTALFITLVGVTMLFSMAESNGTLERVTAQAVRLCRGQVGLLPMMFFVLGLGISTIGPGGTPTSALIAPPAMAVAFRAGVPAFLMAIMAGNGALAGTLSPFAPTGIVSSGVMQRIGLPGFEWQTYAYNVLAHGVVGFGGFLLLGGWRLFTQRQSTMEALADEEAAFERKHWLTLAVIVALIIAVAGFGFHVGMTALAGAALLVLCRGVDEKAAFQRMPWGVILMVTGVTVLISMMERTKGLELFTIGLANVATRDSVAPIVAFGTGVVSVYSSTSGVVLPAFLPTVPGLAARIGDGLEPLPLAWSMNIGASLVDLSSLSTVGALFLAAAPPGTDTRSLFNALLLWGLSMTVVGALLCWILFG
jgi:di/tricarboxylate transporter